MSKIYGNTPETAKEQEDYWRTRRQDLEHDLFIERAKEELKL